MMLLSLSFLTEIISETNFTVAINSLFIFSNFSNFRLFHSYKSKLGLYIVTIALFDGLIQNFKAISGAIRSFSFF